MSNVVFFPIPKKKTKSNLETIIDDKLSEIPKRDREKLKFELLKSIDNYDSFFTEWSLMLPEGVDDQFKEQIYHIARQEHGRKMRMLADIIELKVQVLVDGYYKK